MIQTYIKKNIEAIERQLSLLIPDEDVAHKKLFEAARYSLLNGGKRIRPLLALATAEALGANLESAIVPVCALELVHTYSLIHDDLPCMDNDDYRRGKPTLHKQYDEAMAVLVGDFLLTKAFEILAKASNLGAEQKVKLISLLSQKAGGAGMIAGQVLDMGAENQVIDLDCLKNIHRKKTGALIIASIQFGVILAKANSKIEESLLLFGEEIGLAFQIVDDLIDVLASKNKHGKEISSDEVNGKSTYVSLVGISQSEKTARDLLDSSMDRLKCLNLEDSYLSSLTELIGKRVN